MKILIDATGITREKTGVGVYAKNLIDRLSRNPGTLQFFIFAQDDDPQMDFSRYPGVTMLWVPARFFRILPLRFLLEQIYLPFLLWRLRIEVVHSLHYAFPLLRFGTRQVVTFHDLTFFNMPEVHQWLKIRYFQLFMRAAVRFADHIIFVSRSALDDSVAKLGKPQGKASVVPHGKGEEFCPGVPLRDVERLRAKFNLPQRFVLYIGTIEPRKNLAKLVEAFAPLAAKDPEVSLVLVGKMGWMTDALFVAIERFDLASRVVFTGFIAEEEKAPFLAACTMFVYPSLYEGFGLPVLEALSCGTPTITSNTSALPEVVGDAALLVDPTSTADLAAAMDKLLFDPVLQAQLRMKGPQQAAGFTWEKAAFLTAEVYRSLQPQAVG